MAEPPGGPHDGADFHVAPARREHVPTLQEALECAEYALSHRASDQRFALAAVRDALSRLTILGEAPHGEDCQCRCYQRGYEDA